jgi:hypothetical protein
MNGKLPYRELEFARHNRDAIQYSPLRDTCVRRQLCLKMSPSSYWAKEFGFPDMDQDPVKWNEGCEKLMSVGVIRGRHMIIAAFDLFSERDLQEFYCNHRGRTADLCFMQQYLTTEASESFATKDLEKKWLEADSSTRRSHMLEGLIRVCSIPWNEDTRLYCREVTLDGLEKGGGQSFITLLKSCMLEDASSPPSAPILLPSSEWTFTPSPASSGDWKEETMYASFLLSRSIFICEFHP